jgi:DNA topoisomerase-3
VNNKKVSDHHAILPTEQPANPTALTHEERQIYDLIVRRFLAVLYPPFQYEQMTIVTTVEGERFFSQGKVVKNQGWKAVDRPAPADTASDSEDELMEQPLRGQQEGQSKPVKKCSTNRGQTSPPPRYTEATLLTAMESPGKFIDDEELRESIKTGGLGTPATRAEIIEKLIGNYYLERQGKSLIPTGKAIQLLELVPEELKSPELTAQWELRLSNIAQGQDNRQAFMTDIRKNAVELVNRVKASTATYTPDNLTQNKCPMCGQPMMQVKAKKRQKLVCSDRRCGYEQGSDSGGMGFGRRRSKKEMQMNKRLIRQYSDNASTSTSLGDLLKAALDKES